MPASTVAVIGAGTKLLYGDGGDPETFVELCNAEAIGAIGEQGEFVELNRLCSATREYIAGLDTPPDKQITLLDIPGDVEQEAFITKARNKETVNMRTELSNGRIGDFRMVLSGAQVQEPTQDGKLLIIVYGKQSGATIWSVAA